MRFLTILFVILAAFPAFADENTEKQKLVVEIMKESRMTETMNKSLIAVGDQLKANLQKMRGKLSDEKAAIFQEVFEEEMTKVSNRTAAFGAGFMVQNYTIEDLQVMLEFYKSPTGKKSMALMPQMMMQTQKFMQTILPDAFANIQQKIQTRFDEADAENPS
ncbi:DUF2059 domain-containing protein [Emcibacter nanhaiensis]|uniref:DUF2059 domain-containing protein n=1 Tax=Emcibacter nanhaiensis TaxID=1505037 RepID=A0A501PH91_9PROT|nr:DUF2059 domain-containing protein [Emcibacter nanhaiensis]TPD59371.1 DUF2059 domain-containing protein [Emcibacter nanhaiensis]